MVLKLGVRLGSVSETHSTLAQFHSRRMVGVVEDVVHAACVLWEGVGGEGRREGGGERRGRGGVAIRWQHWLAAVLSIAKVMCRDAISMTTVVPVVSVR